MSGAKDAPTWWSADQSAALCQGWGLFYNTATGTRAIERLDCPADVFGAEGHLPASRWEGPADLSPRFASDDEARAFVAEQAALGVPLARRALAEAKGHP